jgi:hypothetical protein
VFWPDISGETSMDTVVSNQSHSSTLTLTDTPLVLHTLEELQALQTRNKGLRGRPVQLALPCLKPDEAIHYGMRLSRLVSECGCSAGAIASSATIVAVSLWQWVNPPQDAMQIATRIAASLAIIIVAGGLGKLLGLKRARRALAQEIAAISAKAKIN